MSGSTDHYGLTTLSSGESFATDDYKYTKQDRVTIDNALWAGVNHTHNGVVGTLEDPDTALTLDLATTGGTIPASTTVYYKYTLVNANGEESTAGPEAYVTTAAAVASPGAPVLTRATTGGVLLSGAYYYALSAYVGASTSESKATNPAFLTLVSSTATNTITLTLPTLPTGADGFNVYRREPGQTKYFYLDTVAMDVATPPSTYVDDGSVAEDCDRTLPSVNSTNATNQITVTLPGATPAVPLLHTWRLYRSYVPSSWSSSYLVWVVEETSEGSGVITPTYVDIGNSTTSGTYPAISRVVSNPDKVLLTGGAEVQGLLPASMVSGLSSGMSSVTVAAVDSSADDIAGADYTCDGANDEVQFAAAIAAAAGSTVVLASGTYHVGAGTNISTGVTISGAVENYGAGSGRGVTIMRDQTAANFSMFTVSGSLTVFSDLVMHDDNSVANTSPLLALSTSVRFDRCYIENDQTGGVCIAQTVGGGLIFTDCDVQGQGNVITATGITMDIHAERTLFSSYAANGFNLLTLGSNSDIELIDCETTGCASVGYRIDGDTASAVAVRPRVTIRGGKMISNVGEDVYLSDCGPVKISHVRCGQGTVSSIRLDNVYAGVVQGVDIYNAGRHGIWIADSDNVVVTGCNLQEYSVGTDNTYHGIFLDGDTNDCTIEGNQLRSNVHANKALYGIRIGSSTGNNNFISNNDLRGSSKTAGNEVSDLGTNTRGHEVLAVAVSDELSPITTGTAKITFRMPYAFCLTKVRASLSTTSSSGIPTFDINEGGTSIFTAATPLRLTIDVGEKTSTTAATAAVITDSYLADDAEMTVDVDVAGTGAVGAKISLFGWGV